MRREEFKIRLKTLFYEYCRANPNYENLHEVWYVDQIVTSDVKQGVRVVIDTYLYRKEK